MRALLIALALVLAPAQMVSVTNADGVITLLLPAGLADLPRAKATLGGKTVYEGVSLTALLKAAGVPQGPRLHGKPMQAFVVVTGKDGYRAVFSIAEIDPSFRDSPIILADRRESGPLAENEGPLRLVVGGDARPDRGVRQVESIKVVMAP